ncbi:hypothetical protein PPTG_23669 [Phytophthora nicotianae INRA-310]|uniref:Uncharacterized protein n=1 Tax=Phytophthora nicotianae (strain INRA-310) TaxID=761204 RepID=W2PV57_PHYN3|nr:hypothetical protein PPTG_23669 [Phytophthora nicotianae INRA-310]ETN04114.1 hypothetical protein PPTG_23669 [Phytophthora nicotianae INRA-310]
MRGRTGKIVYDSIVFRPTNQQLLAKQYKISVETLNKQVSRRIRSTVFTTSIWHP